MTKSPAKNYAASHAVIRLSAKRYQFSPFAPCYAKPDTVWGLYSGRFYALGWGDDPAPKYESLRRDCVLFDVPERPIDITGPDVPKLLGRVFCRRTADLPVGRGRYAIACRDDGGILIDGVLFHCEADRWWYVPANGEFLPWLHALSIGLDVTIRDAQSFVLQVQGPRSFEVLKALTKGQLDGSLPYFHMRSCKIGDERFLVSRTGWTGEMGFELYTLPGFSDGPALWNRILEAGKPCGLVASSLEAMGIRRIEAGILDNGTDMDPSLNPFEAGLEKFVDLKSGDFVGRAALAKADRRPLLLGIICKEEMPVAGQGVWQGNAQVGRITTGAWSPHLKQGIGYVRFAKAGDWQGAEVRLGDAKGPAASIVPLPFYDAEKKIPRGLGAA